jgi:phosphatidylglycerophosphatase A
VPDRHSPIGAFQFCCEVVILAIRMWMASLATQSHGPLVDQVMEQSAPESVLNSQPRSWADRAVLLIATGLGLGFVHFAPGTIGSLAGLPVAWGLHFLPLWGQVAAAVFFFLFGIPICAGGARLLGTKDPGAVVFDEIAAFSVLFLLVPFGIAPAVAGFVLFRLFDVWKPWPARRLERLPGGLGIMADDFAAALYAAASLWLIDRYFPLG